MALFGNLFDCNMGRYGTRLLEESSVIDVIVHNSYSQLFFSSYRQRRYLI